MLAHRDGFGITFLKDVPKLQWGHGLSAVETGNTSGHWIINRSFNGATAFQPWKPRRIAVEIALPDSPLQWGHGLSAVET